MLPSIEYRFSQQTEWQNEAFIFWTNSLQRSIENRQRLLSSQLRMIDTIKSHSGMSEDQQKIIIDKLLDDSQLKNLVS